MPKGFHFFDTIVRQGPLDDETLRLEDNLEEFEPLGEGDLDAMAADAAAARATGRAVIASVGGTALGVHARQCPIGHGEPGITLQAFLISR